MADCESLARCPFFNDQMKDMDGMSSLYKQRYCHSEFARCARFMVSKAKGRGAVPSDLFPNQLERAGKILTPN